MSVLMSTRGHTTRICTRRSSDYWRRIGSHDGGAEAAPITTSIPCPHGRSTRALDHAGTRGGHIYWGRGQATGGGDARGIWGSREHGDEDPSGRRHDPRGGTVHFGDRLMYEGQVARATRSCVGF